MNCPSCQQMVQQTDRFCGSCGTTVPTPVVPPFNGAYPGQMTYHSVQPVVQTVPPPIPPQPSMVPQQPQMVVAAPRRGFSFVKLSVFMIILAGLAVGGFAGYSLLNNQNPLDVLSRNDANDDSDEQRPNENLASQQTQAAQINNDFTTMSTTGDHAVSQNTSSGNEADPYVSLDHRGENEDSAHEESNSDTNFELANNNHSDSQTEAEKNHEEFIDSPESDSPRNEKRIRLDEVPIENEEGAFENEATPVEEEANPEDIPSKPNDGTFPRPEREKDNGKEEFYSKRPQPEQEIVDKRGDARGQSSEFGRNRQSSWKEIDEQYLQHKNNLATLSLANNGSSEMNRKVEQAVKELEDLKERFLSRLEKEHPELSRQLDEIQRQKGSDRLAGRVEGLLKDAPRSAYFHSLIAKKICLPKKMISTAEYCLREALIFHPENTFYLTDLGWVQFNHEKWKAAESTFRTASQKHPKSMAIRSLLIKALIKRGKTKEAEKLARDGLKSEKSLITWDALGMVLLGKGQPKEAQGVYEEALSQSHERDFYQINMKIGICLVDQGKLMAADEVMSIPRDDFGLRIELSQLLWERQSRLADTKLPKSLNWKHHFEVAQEYLNPEMKNYLNARFLEEGYDAHGGNNLIEPL